jgi:hypothetical protein
MTGIGCILGIQAAAKLLFLYAYTLHIAAQQVLALQRLLRATAGGMQAAWCTCRCPSGWGSGMDGLLYLVCHQCTNYNR